MGCAAIPIVETAKPNSPGPSEEATAGRTAETTGVAVDPVVEPEEPPPAVFPIDPFAPATHEDGGTYAKDDFSRAARRSEVHQDQLEPRPGPDEGRVKRSTFAAAADQEGPSSIGGGQ